MFMIMQVRSYHWVIITITTGLFLQGCMQSSALPDTQRPTNWGVAIDKHYNFYRVNSWLYRSEQPSSELLPYLQQQQIDIVINLRVHNEDRQLLQHVPVQLFHIPINTWDIERQDIVKVMQILQAAKAQHKRVLIHCYHGVGRAEIYSAIYRIEYEGWDRDEARNATRAFTKFTAFDLGKPKGDFLHNYISRKEKTKQ